MAQMQDGRQTFDPSEVTLAVTSRDPECIDVMSPKSHYDVLARILLLYAKLNRGVRYVQGMNELCAPLYYLFAQDPLNFQYAEAAWQIQSDGHLVASGSEYSLPQKDMFI